MIVLSIALVADRLIVFSFNEAVLEDTRINLSEIENSLNNHYRSYHDDLYFLYGTPPVKGLTRALEHQGIDPFDGTTNAQLKSRLSDIFISFMQNNEAYFQLRLLDAQGKEAIRVERHSGEIIALNENDLQDKSDRYYFIETKNMAERQLFVSHIDLNREHGRITFPYVPTLRMALPIYTDSNQFYGEIIANIDATSMLDELEVLVSEHLVIVLTDFEHYFIKHPNKDFRFSRDLAPQHKFDSEYAEKESGFKGLSLFSVKSASEKMYGVGEKFSVEMGDDGGSLYGYILMGEQYYNKQLQDRRFESLVGLVVVLVLSLVLLFYFARNNKKLATLLANAEEAKAAVDVAEDAVITVDHEWRINTANSAFERLFLFNEKQSIGQSITDLLLRFGGAEVAEALQSHLGTGATGIEWQVPVSDGVNRWFHCKVNRIDNEQAIAQFAIVIRDITAEKEAMLKVAETNRQLEEKVEQRTVELKRARDEALQVSELKTNFISTISHEMRTPLNGIVGATNLLKNEVLDAKQAKLLTMAENSVESLKRLINDILDLSKIEAGKLELDFRHFNPEGLLESITSTMSVVANQKGLGFYIDTCDLNINLIKSDPHRLTQVINNLLNNAIKFTENGYIKVACRSEIEEHTARLIIDITDTGKGIAQENMNRLFKAFSQADNSIATSYGGTGLGLSICREIITLLGGTIGVESEEGRGSCFSFTIPVEQWQAKSPEDRTRLVGKTAGLLLGESPLATVVNKLLASHGATALSLTSARELKNLQSLSMVFVCDNCPQYSALCQLWQQWGEEGAELPTLFIISREPLDSADRPPLSYNMVEPLYRSVFLSHVANSRYTLSEVPVDTSAERRYQESELKLEINDELTGKTVLVVDDNEINRQVASFILEPFGLIIVMAENGENALKQLRDNPAISLILMDCNMPVLNGYDATRAIRAGRAGLEWQTIPIIAMTANAMKGESEKCKEAGMDDYLTKPVEAAQMIRKLKRFLKPAQQTSEAPEAESVDLQWQRDEAIGRLAGNENLYRKLLALFLEQGDEKLAAIQQAVQAKDKEAIRFTCHSLKGVAAEVGAEDLKERLASLEYNVQTLSEEGVDKLYVQISLQMAACMQRFSAYLNEETSALAP
ncbi:ATP-binding protein [Alteromonas lipolytica]|uniref:ATP-binding protein n=1 Tax=Alteromonas lipolytica TaxID=1856405 RepID=UPI0015861D02|nr:ATP-binding protein [Alteromonas lipolytica]GGF54904.1 hypothetical protein GCM10011338_03900 [Alteromonas lipolytica]